MAEGAIQCVSRHIKEWRHATGLNQLQFAERCGLDVDKFKRLEAGKGVLENAIDLLKIAEACNKDYAELYERTDETYITRGAYIPDGVMQEIEKLAKATGDDHVKLAKKLSTTSQAVDNWMRGHSSPTPWNFSNLITLFNLNAKKLEAMITPNGKESKPEAATAAPVTVERKNDVSELEQKMLNIMMLQHNIDEYIAQLDIIIAGATKMRDNLLSLK